MERGIFAAGSQASGLRWLRKGFGFTDEDDKLFALGFPHLVYLVPGDAAAKELADPTLFGKEYKLAGFEIATGIAPRLVRYTLAAPVDLDAQRAAIEKVEPLSDDEANRAIAQAVRGGVASPKFIVHLVGAQRSPAYVVERVLAEYEALSLDDWRQHSVEAASFGALQALHFTLLRASQAEADRAHERLRALHGKLQGNLDPAQHRTYSWLTFLIEPKPEGLVPRALLSRLPYFTPDDAELVCATWIPVLERMKPGDGELMDARLCFLGGAPMIEAYAAHAKQFAKDDQTALVEQMERVNHPAVVTLMATIANSRAKKWLKAHGHA